MRKEEDSVSAKDSNSTKRRQKAFRTPWTVIPTFLVQLNLAFASQIVWRWMLWKPFFLAVESNSCGFLFNFPFWRHSVSLLSCFSFSSPFFLGKLSFHLCLCLPSAKLHVFDYDRFSRDDSIGEVFLPLCQVDFTGKPSFWKALKPPAKDKCGELLCSLCYHPSNSILTLSLVKARNLKAKDINGKSGE